MPLSNAVDASVNKHIFGAAVYTPPATLYFGLSTSTPAPDGTGVTEPVGNGYARVAVVNNNTNFVAATGQPATGQSQANGVAIQFAAASGPWGACTYVVIYDALTNGNLVAFYQLTTTKSPVSGDSPVFAIQALTLTLQ